jgi:3-hydroxyacyl-CoA dehydrogenase
MTERSVSTVAVVGTGVIGRSWIQVFARAGCQTRVYDREPAQVKKALVWFEEVLEQDCQAGLLTAKKASARRARVTSYPNLIDALAGAGYVQESGPERIELKKALFAELDRDSDPKAILGSSTSAMDMTDIASGLNPPHVVPVVEVLPGERTAPEIVKRTCAFLTDAGQTPVLMNFYVPGFLLNRMQAALVKEAVSLVMSGVADVDAVDAVIRDGLGLRWALMGPFGVANTNADGGVREYFTRYGDDYVELMNALGPTPAFDPASIERIGQATDDMVGDIDRAKICRWRDRMVRKIRALKGKDPLR